MKHFNSSSIRIATLLVCLILSIATGCKKDDKAPPPPGVPVVATAALTNITTNSATGGGSIVSDGGETITASGIVWSETNAMPTLADSVVASAISSGTFTVNISGLEFNKSYYIRAFATNSVGTGYGDVIALNTTDDTTKVRFTYNGEEVVYGIIVSPTTGKKWLDRNLGAQRVATAGDDYQAYGDLFQWGRPDDGHQLIVWSSSAAGTGANGTTPTLATSDTPNDNKFILAAITDPYNGDWRSDNNRNRWAVSPQGPCPSGWHVPTIAEWKAEVAVGTGSGAGGNGTATSGGMVDSRDAYDFLKLPVAGWREGHNWGDGTEGQIGTGSAKPGVAGFYWSSSDQISTPDPWTFGEDAFFSSSGFYFGTIAKAAGLSVRCVKD